YPVSGTVKYVHYNKGKFINAAADKASLENEQSSVGIEVGSGYRVLVRQIAGLIARRIVTYSKVGERVNQGDRLVIIRFGSLVDAITFGLTPVLIMYFAVLNRERWDWFWCFLFAACAVLRLARFNVEQAGTAKTYFQGLPSPAAGITLSTYYWFSQSPLYAETNISNWPWHQMLRLVMAGLSFLMISNVPYPVIPPIGFRSVRGLVGLGTLLVGISM